MARVTDKEKPKRSAGEEALRYLANRMRTVKEMRKHLQDKGYEPEEIEPVIEECLQKHYLDDHAYAHAYFEYAFQKHRGGMRAKRELMERGLSEEVVRNAYEDYMYESGHDEYSEALIAARKTAESSSLFGSSDPADQRKLAAKVARRLEGLGYRGDDIYRVLGELRSWQESDKCD